MAFVTGKMLLARVENWKGTIIISEKHQQAMLAWSDYKINQASHTSIASTLNTESQEQIRKNRHYLKTVLEIIKFCSFQEIALRGHREVFFRVS